MPTTSMNEDKLLKIMGVPEAERGHIEGLQMRRSSSSTVSHRRELSVEELSSIALVRLAAEPPPEVALLQRKTQWWLARCYPLGMPTEVELKICTLEGLICGLLFWQGFDFLAII
eukprot:7385754-Prymnesium_polylepis.1